MFISYTLKFTYYTGLIAELKDQVVSTHMLTPSIAVFLRRQTNGFLEKSSE